MESKRGKPRNKDEIEAIVTTVYPDGSDGPYFVAISEQVEGSITASYSAKIWSESDPPKPGDVVMLGQVHKVATKTGGGLRAETARLWRLEDFDDDE